jgi:ring-1,2-phenylacetyl-CoA epoxidase subunit PaaA
LNRPLTAVETSPDLGNPEYREALVEMLANHMVGEALGADALGPHFRLCPDLHARRKLGIIIEQEAKHGYMLARLLKDLGENPEQHFLRITGSGLPPYHRMMIQEKSWTNVIVGSVFLIDPTGVAFMTANMETNYLPLRGACDRMLKEEAFHIRFGRAEFRKLADAGRDECQDAINVYFPIALKIMGKKDSKRGENYQRLGLRKLSAGQIRENYLSMVIPWIEAAGLTVPEFERW